MYKKYWVVLTQALGQMWTNPNIGLKIIKKCNPMAGFVHI